MDGLTVEYLLVLSGPGGRWACSRFPAGDRWAASRFGAASLAAGVGFDAYELAEVATDREGVSRQRMVERAACSGGGRK